MNSTRVITLIAGLTVAAIAMAGCSGSADPSDAPELTEVEGIPEGLPEPTADQLASWSDVDGAVYFITPGADSARWSNFDVPYVTDALEALAPDASLVTITGDDQDSQRKAVDAALAAGAAGIVFVAASANDDTAGMLKEIDDAGVPVLSYVNDVFDVPFDVATGEGAPRYHVGTSLIDEYMVPGCEMIADEAAGRDEPIRVAYFGPPAHDETAIAIHNLCMTHLQPAVDDGDVEFVCDERVATFDPAEFQKATEQCLSRTAGEIDAILTHNDDVIGGVVAALSAQSLAGEIPIYGGYDATLAGVQRVVAGWQEYDVFQPYAQVAYMAVMLLLSEITGSATPEGFPNYSYWNGAVASLDEDGVPAAILDSIRISNADDVRAHVEGVFYTREQICSPDGPAAATDYCTE